jgi:hypothetical protein
METELHGYSVTPLAGFRLLGCGDAIFIFVLTIYIIPYIP